MNHTLKFLGKINIHLSLGTLKLVETGVLIWPSTLMGHNIGRRCCNCWLQKSNMEVGLDTITVNIEIVVTNKKRLQKICIFQGIGNSTF